MSLTPYYQSAAVTLYLGDCLTILPQLAAGVDLVLADPPYGTTACKWDTVIPLAPLWAELKRLVKPRAAVVLTASQPFTSALVMSNPKWFRYEWIWEKSNGTGFLDANRKPLKCHESILVFSERRPSYRPQKTAAERKITKRTSNAPHYGEHTRITTSNNGEACPRSVLYFPKERGTQHPTQKPVALMAYLIRTYAAESETILDFACGSGTTLVAALQTGRKAIGVELSEPYAEIAAKRLEEAARS